MLLARKIEVGQKIRLYEAQGSKTVGTIRSIFCPVHRRRADFKLRDSGDPENPDLVCLDDGYTLSYKELT
jgi:hypothetical protein